MFRQKEAPRHDGDMDQYWQSCSDDRFGWCLHAVILAGQQEAEEGKRFDRECGGVRYTYEVDRLIACDELMHCCGARTGLTRGKP
jgi:hypothetical protein